MLPALSSQESESSPPTPGEKAIATPRATRLDIRRGTRRHFVLDLAPRAPGWLPLAIRHDEVAHCRPARRPPSRVRPVPPVDYGRRVPPSARPHQPSHPGPPALADGLPSEAPRAGRRRGRGSITTACTLDQLCFSDAGFLGKSSAGALPGALRGPVVEAHVVGLFSSLWRGAVPRCSYGGLFLLWREMRVVLKDTPALYRVSVAP